MSSELKVRPVSPTCLQVSSRRGVRTRVDNVYRCTGGEGESWKGQGAEKKRNIERERRMEKEKRWKERDIEIYIYKERET